MISPIQVFVILVAIAGVVFLVRYFVMEKEWLTVRVEVRGRDWSEDFTGGSAYKAPDWLARQVKIGDKETGLDGRELAEVLGIEEYGDENPVVFMIARIRVTKNQRTQKYAFKNRAVEAGSGIEFQFPQVKILGQVVDLDASPSDYQQKTVVAEVRAQNLEPWVVEQISKGDVMVNKATGEEVGEIVDFHLEPPVSSVFYTNPDYFTNAFIERNPRLKDAVLTVRLQMRQYDQGWRFAGNQIVKVGRSLWFYFDSYNLSWVVVQNFRDE